jgi:hypothetical protein
VRSTSGRHREGPRSGSVAARWEQAGTPAHAAPEAAQAESRSFASLNSAGEFLDGSAHILHQQEQVQGVGWGFLEAILEVERFCTLVFRVDE